MKTNKGLTLIALVITIIVLLIMAGVSISIAVGDNGVLTRAAKTEIEYNKGEVLESLNLFSSEYYLKRYEEAPEEQRAQVQVTADEFIRALYIGWNENDEEASAPEWATTTDDWKKNSFFFKDNNWGSLTEKDDYLGCDQQDTVGETTKTYRTYLINLNALKRQITKYGNGNSYGSGDVFIIRRELIGVDGTNKIYSNNIEVCYKTGVNDSVNPQGVAVIGSINLAQP